MSKYIPGNQKHLTLDDRIFIQNELSKGTFYNAKNFCIHRYHCKKTNACGKIILCGINMTKRELHQKDRIISPLIEQGQSPYQIITNHPELELSVRSVYTYLNMGILTARNIDLKRKVKFKPRKVHKSQISDRNVFQNRTYADFQRLGIG